MTISESEHYHKHDPMTKATHTSAWLHYTLITPSLPQRLGKPLKTLVETVTSGSASRLDVLECGQQIPRFVTPMSLATYPGTARQALQTQLLGNLGGAHGVLQHHVSMGKLRRQALARGTYRQVLLVGEDKEKGITEFILIQHALQLLTGLHDTITVIAVDDEDDALGVLIVVSPQRTNLVLTTDVPHGEVNVLVLDRLDVETYSATSIRQSHAPFPFARNE